MSRWFEDAFVYHVYPLGALGAPARNDFSSPASNRLDRLYPWLEAAASLGANAIYLGPVFESTAHGYDTADYFHVDRRLGDTNALTRWSEALHRRGMKLLLDGVFHHVGRDFWAFRDLLAAPESSRYRDWFFIDPTKKSPYGDRFAYQGWNGHYDLVKLNVGNPEVKNHLFEAIRSWVQQFDIDGLRLDAADVLDIGFQSELSRFCRSLRADFCLLGEVIHGDYRRWINEGSLDSVTNYEVHKGLFSSQNDRNYFELAHSLKRQFARDGIYEGFHLNVFADNHDVDRIASRLKEPAEIYPLHILLFTIPGVPSIYYGSEWGIPGRKDQGGDAALRPALDPTEAAKLGTQPDLPKAIEKLASLRRALPALRHGTYRDLLVAHRQFAFERAHDSERVIVAVNAAEMPTEIRLEPLDGRPGKLVDLLNEGESFELSSSLLLPLSARWGRVLRWTPSDLK